MTAAEARAALTKAQTKKFLAALELSRGNHKEAEKAFCVMEAVAYVAGEPHSDHPKCASPVLTRFCIGLNDRWALTSKERVNQLKPYVLRLVGTKAAPEIERERAYMCADWAVRECLPMALEWGKIGGDWAERLRALPALVDVASANAGRDLAREALEAAREKWKTADAYAADAAAAAYAYAAYAAAAYAAADAYAADAAAARAKADASALALLDRMIALTEKRKS